MGEQTEVGSPKINLIKNTETVIDKRVAIKVRDYQLDNIKAIIIFLVVLGHALTSMVDQSEIIRGIYIFIYFFHMPVMVFISGYLSKNLVKIRETAFVSILLPFVILNVVFYLFRVVLLGEEYFGFRFLYPLRGLWYLLALFIWKFFLKDLVKIRFLLLFSVLLGLFAGFTREFSSFLALGRVVNMLPFFILGYYSTKDKHWKVVQRIPKVFSIIAILITAGIAAYLAMDDEFRKSVLFLRGAYPQEAEVQGFIMRILIYIIATMMVCVFINLTSNKKTIISEVGTNSLTVYIIHLFIITLLERFELLMNQPLLYIPYAVGISIAMVYILSRPRVKRVYDWIMDQLVNIIIKKSYK